MLMFCAVGSFLIPYVLFLICAGVPIFFLEISLGQLTSKGGVGCWNVCPLFRGTTAPLYISFNLYLLTYSNLFTYRSLANPLAGVGIACTVIITLCDIYYIVLLDWALVYMSFSFQDNLPWASCDNYWNTPE